MGLWQVWAALRTATHGHTGRIPVLLALVLIGPKPLGFTADARPDEPAPTASSSPSATPPPVQVDPETGKVFGGYAGGSDDIEPNEHGSTRPAPIGPEPSSWPALEGNPAEIGLYYYVQRTTFRHDKDLAGRSLSIVGSSRATPTVPTGRGRSCGSRCGAAPLTRCRFS